MQPQADEMAQWLKMPAAKPDRVCSLKHMVKERTES